MFNYVGITERYWSLIHLSAVASFIHLLITKSYSFPGLTSLPVGLLLAHLITFGFSNSYSQIPWQQTFHQESIISCHLVLCLHSFPMKAVPVLHSLNLIINALLEPSDEKPWSFYFHATRNCQYYDVLSDSVWRSCFLYCFILFLCSDWYLCCQPRESFLTLLLCPPQSATFIHSSIHKKCLFSPPDKSNRTQPWPWETWLYVAGK